MHRVRLEREGSAAVVVAGGELDAFAAPELERVLAETGEEPALVVDLSAVSFLDSTALGVVVRGLRRHRERSGQARLVLPRGTARRIFEITTLDRVLPVAATREQALSEVS